MCVGDCSVLMFMTMFNTRSYWIVVLVQVVFIVDMFVVMFHRLMLVPVLMSFS